jgi:hypothetical protein
LAPSGFVIQDLLSDDTHGIDQAAALLVAAFPRWTATLDAARDEVAELLKPAHLPDGQNRKRGAWLDRRDPLVQPRLGAASAGCAG